MNIIIDNKVNLIEWLCGEEMILQHVHSRNLVTMNEYRRIKSIQEPNSRITELLDIILSKQETICVAFLELLKEDRVNESRPDLRKWIRTVKIPALGVEGQNSDMTHAGAASVTGHLKFLNQNRSKLIDNVKTVDRIVDDLNFTNEMTANVRAERTDQAKMRKVLEYTNSTKAAQLLVEVLFEHVADVMEELIAA